MRTFGPGSISSFLKTILDVLYGLLLIGAAVLAAAAAAALLSQPFLGTATVAGREGEVTAALRRGPALAGVFLACALDLACLIVVAQRLRRVLATMTAGDPFEPDNVRRLRTIGAALIVLQPAGLGLSFAVANLVPASTWSGPEISVSGCFAVLIVFVLAEVFREGARLRQEARLTV